MADVVWTGRAQAVSQVDTVTIALTWGTADEITLTINGTSLVVVVGSLTTTAQVATTIKEAWNNETLTDTTASYTPADGGQGLAEFAELTATVDSSVVSITNTAGVPFTLSVTEVTAGDGTATEATATACSGPNFWNVAANWDTLAVPVGGDHVYIDDSDVSILYGLGNSGVTVGSLNIGSGFTGQIGLPKYNPNGYLEYRADYLAIGATAINIGDQNIGERGGQGSGRIKIDSGPVVATIEVRSTGAPLETGLESVLWKGTATTNVLEALSGSVGVGVFQGETAHVLTTRIDAAAVRFGNGTVFDAGGSVTSENGQLVAHSAIVSLTMSGGSALIQGSGTIGVLVLRGGTLRYQSSGTITTATIGGAVTSTFDCSGDFSSRTISTLNVSPNMVILDPLRTITYTTIAWGSDVNSWSTQ